MTTGRLQGRVALVTGAAQGIGRTIAERFAREKACVMLGDVRAQAGADAAAAIRTAGGAAAFQTCDVAAADQVEALCRAAIDAFGHLDCAVANAGIAAVGDFLTFGEGEFDRVLRTNLRGAFLTAQAAARHMDAGGSIVLMSSINGRLAMPRIAANCVAKGAVNQLARAAAVALADRGIRVNALAPGSVEAGMVYDVLGDPADWDAVLSRTPSGRLASPEEVAAATVFLAGADSGYMTGQCVTLDGGRSALDLLAGPPA